MNLKKIVIGLVILGLGYFAYTKLVANKNTKKIKEGSFTIEVEDGGPAFPSANNPGMSLRDYFAAKALPTAIKEVEDAGTYNLADVAAIAYQYADAMLKERQT